MFGGVNDVTGAGVVKSPRPLVGIKIDRIEGRLGGAVVAGEGEIVVVTLAFHPVLGTQLPRLDDAELGIKPLMNEETEFVSLPAFQVCQRLSVCGPDIGFGAGLRPRAVPAAPGQSRQNDPQQPRGCAMERFRQSLKPPYCWPQPKRGEIGQ